MRLIFRADASPDIGSGHAMRCSAIAEEAIARGIDCILVGSLGGISWLEKRFEDIKCRVLPVENFLQSQTGDVLVVDSYLLQSNDCFISQDFWKSRVDIVDELTPTRESDLFIHPGLESRWFTGNRAKLLSGPKYIPIRKSIIKSRNYKSLEISKLVIFGGGTDFYGFARVMGQELCNLPGFKHAIFFSRESNYIEELDGRFKVLPFGTSLDTELRDADLVFTTASTSSLEIIAREIPLGVACSVSNQVANYETFGDSNIAARIGVRATSGKWDMHSEVIHRLITDSRFRDDLNTTAYDYIDLLGTKRILDAIIAL